MAVLLRALLAIALLAGLIALIIWSPWKPGDEETMPDDVFGAYSGNWEGKFTSYSIQGTWQESYRQVIRLKSVSRDSQAGIVVVFSPQGDTLSRDSLFHLRRGDSIYCLRTSESGSRELDHGYWADGQIIWRSQDIFGRVSHAYRAFVRKGVWETNGFKRTDRGDYLLQYGRAIKR
jgi:hypothetical protein